MLPFRIAKEAREWFRDLGSSGEFRIVFDAYFFCFLAGIATHRKIQLTSDETDELVDHFPQVYQPNGRLIVGLFLVAELKDLGISLTDRATVHEAISRYVNPSALHFLSDQGVQEFNKYAHGGFEVLREWFVHRPQSLATFLQTFKKHLDKALLANEKWGDDAQDLLDAPIGVTS